MVKRIFYTAKGLPLLEIDSVIYNFNRPNALFIIGELSSEIELCNEIKTRMVDCIKEAVSQQQSINVDSPSVEIRKYIDSLAELSEFHIVNDILIEAVDNYKQLITPKPYESWVWNRELENWEAPYGYPQGADSGVYIWSEEDKDWIPAEPAPHVSWVWDTRTQKYEPPVSYPLDAQEGEFVWDEEKLSWVLNV